MLGKLIFSGSIQFCHHILLKDDVYVKSNLHFQTKLGKQKKVMWCQFNGVWGCD